MSWQGWAAIGFWIAAMALNVQVANRHGAARWARVFVPTLFGITLLVLWQGLVRGLAVSPVILPAPTDIAAAPDGSAAAVAETAVATVTVPAAAMVISLERFPVMNEAWKDGLPKLTFDSSRLARSASTPEAAIRAKATP